MHSVLTSVFPKAHILINLQALAGALKELNWPAGIGTHSNQKKGYISVLFTLRTYKSEIIVLFYYLKPKLHADFYLEVAEAPLKA